MTPTPEPLRSKHWTPDHVALVRGVLDARAMLRGLLPRLPIEHQQTVARALNCMGCALKARGPANAHRAAIGQHSATDTPRRQTIFRPGTPSEGIPIAQLRQLQPQKTTGMEADAEGQ